MTVTGPTCDRLDKSRWLMVQVASLTDMNFVPRNVADSRRWTTVIFFSFPRLLPLQSALAALEVYVYFFICWAMFLLAVVLQRTVPHVGQCLTSNCVAPYYPFVRWPMPTQPVSGSLSRVFPPIPTFGFSTLWKG